MRLTFMAGTVLFVLAIGRSGSAQEVQLWKQLGTTQLERFGNEMRGVADVDGDGIRDLLTTRGEARVVVLSSADGAVKADFPKPVGYFGGCPDAIGDIDQDGWIDLSVAYVSFLGTLAIYSTRTGAEIWSITPTDLYEGFARSHAAIGDIDGDGFGDVLVGAIQYSIGPGYVAALSGIDGHELWRSVGTLHNDIYGWRVARMGDLDGDLHDDWCATARSGGYLRIGSGRTGATILQLHESGAGYGRPPTFFGDNLAVLRDLDNDGADEILVGSPDILNVGGVFLDGRFSLYSGAKGTLLLQEKGAAVGDRVGQMVAAVGDINRDGVDDFAVKSYRDSRDEFVTTLYSGRLLAPMYHFENVTSMAAAGKVNGDVDADYVIGFADEDFGGVVDAGSVRMLSGHDLWADNDPSILLNAGETILHTIRDGIPGNLCMLAVTGINGVPTFAAFWGYGTFDMDGAWTYSDTVPRGLEGWTIEYKAFAINALGKISMSPIEVTTFAL